MILGIPVFLITTTICAFALEWLEGDIVGWRGAFILGTLVSITDPVEGIEILSKLHASHKFITIIELESLVNDGVGIIFFNFFTSLAILHNPKEPAIEYLANVCIRQGLGALAFGWIVKLITEKWLRIIHSDTVNSINVTVIASYLAFCCAEVNL